MPFKRLSQADPHAAFADLWKENQVQEKIRVARTLYPEIWEVVRRHCPPGARILEAGCGLGGWLNCFHQSGFEAHGVDFVASAVDRLKAYDPTLRVSTQDCTRMDFPDHFFDVYFSLGVIEHLETGPAPFLQEALRVLKPGGTGLISVPCSDYLQFGDNAPNDKVFFQYEFTLEEFVRELEGNGFEVLDLVPYGYFLYPNSIPCFREDSGVPYELNAFGKHFMEQARRTQAPRFAIMQLAVVRPRLPAQAEGGPREKIVLEMEQQEMFHHAPEGEVKKSIGSSFFRGEDCHFLPYKTDFRNPAFLEKFLLKGWVPDAPILHKETRITAFGSCFAAHLTRHLGTVGYNLSKNRDPEIYISLMGEGLVNTHALLGA